MSCHILVVVGFAALPQLQAQRGRTPGGEYQRSTATRQQETADEASSETLPSAEAMLQALRRYKPGNDAIAPISTGHGLGESEQHKLWPEGTTVISRPGRLHYDGDWWLVSWVDDPDDPPVRVLPSAALEQMVRTTDDGKLAVVLEVTGEYAVFEEMNYLLVTVAARSSRSVALSSRSQANPVSDGRPSESAVRSPSNAASVNDVLETLKNQKPRRKVLQAGDRGNARSIGRQKRVAPWASIPDGSPISRRPGRVVRQGHWWTFVFESGSVDHPELPMKLLPNLSVENMARAASQDGQAGLVFLVSGEVTAFLGENFLLARSALQRVDTGNLRQ